VGLPRYGALASEIGGKMKILERIELWLVIILETVLQICLVLMTLGVFSQVIFRMFFKMTFLPIEDILPYSFSISTFAGSALLFREKGHIAITFLTDWIKGAAGKILRIVSETLTLFFLGLFLLLGVTFTAAGRFQFSPLLKIPLLYIFSIVPVCAFASIVFLLRRYARFYKNKDKRK
jgi:TRAP-type C4-dicarboxylate transport system permease small subunit